MRTMALVATLAILFTGCGRGGFSERSSAGKENIVRISIDTSPTTFDPAIVQDLDTGDLLLNIYEGLVGWDAQNNLKPALAARWEVDDAGTTYTFHLKSAKFHNGRAVTAADVEFSLERALSPATHSPTAANYLSDIVGAADVASGKTEDLKGVEVVDPTTVRIRIAAPRAYFLGKLTYACGYVLCREALKGGEIKGVAEIVGTGPFRVTEIVPDQLVRLAAFDDYHGGRPIVDGIERPVMKDAASRLNKFRAGELDALALERGDVSGVQKDPDLKGLLRLEDRPGVFYVALNPLAEPAFKDVRVRQAIAMAIDKQWICREALSGLNEPANAFVPPGVAGHRKHTAAHPFDPAKARALLDAAGYKDRARFPTLYLALREQGPDARIVSEAIAGQLAKNLGIRVELRTMEWRAFLEKRNRKALAFYHNSWYADYLDPQNFLSFLFTTGVPQNAFGYSNPTVDALCAKADAARDPAQRLTLYAKAEDQILIDAPWVPIYFAREALLVRKGAQIRTNLFGYLRHTRTRL